MYFGCTVAVVARTTTEPSIDPEQVHALGQGRGQGMGPGTGSGFGQGGHSGLAVGVPEVEAESDGMYEDCYASVCFQLK